MSDTADERVRITTYVPRWQKERWATHADALDMSQSEFLRTMVQAGRRGFEFEGAETPESEALGGRASNNPAEGNPPAATPGEDGLNEAVLSALGDGRYRSWDELVAELSDDFEDRLEAALDELQSADRVRYSGRHGGYTLVGE